MNPCGEETIIPFSVALILYLIVTGPCWFVGWILFFAKSPSKEARKECFQPVFIFMLIGSVLTALLIGSKYLTI